MNAFSSSPPPFRKTAGNMRGGTYSAAMNDLDELTDPSTPYTTQPTQLVGKTALASRTLEITSSPPPRSIIEVPASSPFSAMSNAPKYKNANTLNQSKSNSFANRLAPAGTAFRPPQPQPRGQKRPAAEPILIESDEEISSPTRVEIRPTSFKKRIQSFEYLPDEVIDERADQVYLTTKVYPYRLCREALKACHNNVNDAVGYLVDGRHLLRTETATHQPPSATSSFERKPSVQKQMKPYQSPLPSRSPSPAKPKPKPRRRLIQGRRPNRSPSPHTSPAKAPTTTLPEIIDVDTYGLLKERIVIPDDNSGDYDVGDALEDTIRDSLQDDKALKMINESSLEDLAAMTNLKVDELKIIGEKRPFTGLRQVQRVALPQKPGSRKSSKMAVGETLVERIGDFTKAVNTIDDVVAMCEGRASRVKDELGQWNIDFRGHTRSAPSSGASTPSSDPLLTPRSLKSQQSQKKLVDPPIPTQPKLMHDKCEMRPFQLFGLNWMKVLYGHGYGCILADEMGLGKTCQVISLMAHLVESYDEESTDPRPWPNLIVVPPSTLSNWEAEFEKFAPELSVLTYQGSQAVRQEIAEEMLETPFHVVLTSYTQVGKEEDIEALRELAPNAAIFDEGHKMKNMNTKIYKDLVKIKANWRMLLTGTPVQNNLKEMLALLNFIDPAMFKAHLAQLNFIFGQKITTRDVNNGAFLYGERISRARNILEPFILQRRKDQVLSDMPKKTCEVIYCDLVDSQKELYDRYESLFRAGPVKVKSDARQNDQNNPWIQLRKAAIHPQLFRRYFTDAKVEKMAKILMKKVPQSELQQPELRHLIGELKNCSDFELHLWCRDYPCIQDFDIPEGSWMESGKVVKMLELIHQYQKNGDRVLVFSKFAKVIEILREVLHTDGIEHCVLYGATSVDERQGLINEFNNNRDKTVFLLTTGAGGTGINLTSANKVIIFDQSDNPQDDIQAENRAHRLGQTRDVEIIRLLTTHTIEELIYKACSKKIELANKVTGVSEDMGKEAEDTLEKEVRKLLASQRTPP